MVYAAAVSRHPLTAHATGEVAGALLEQGASRADLVTVFTTVGHAGALEDVGGALAATLQPLAVVGCAAAGVVGPGGRLVWDQAVTALAAPVGPLRTVRLTVDDGDRHGPTVSGWPDDLPFRARALVLFADPWTFPLDWFLHWLAGAHPGLTVVGGAPAGSRGPGGARLLVGGRVHDDGAVGVLLGPAAGVTAAVVRTGPGSDHQPGDDAAAAILVVPALAALEARAAPDAPTAAETARSPGPAPEPGSATATAVTGFASVAQLCPVHSANARHVAVTVAARLGTRHPAT